MAEELSFDEVIKAIRLLKSKNLELNRELREANKEIKNLTKTIEQYKKLLGAESDRSTKIPVKQKLGGKARWLELKMQWASENPDQALLPDRISDALKSWEVPFRGYIHGNRVLEQFIKWAKDTEKGVSAKEIFNIVTLMSRVDFDKYTEYVPTIRATEHIIDKFTKFKEFFERERIYYYPKGSTEYRIDTSSFKREYLVESK